jgi:tetratricopeptide (TPR) repeat protein
MIEPVEVLLLLLLGAHPSLDKAARALAEFRPDDAVKLLNQAKEEGPYAHNDHVRLYEQLGIAYAYLERSDDAKHAFDVMLGLEPTHAISYTLSPKVTFLFEQARANAIQHPTPAIDLSWSRDLTVEDRIPIAVEVIADPHRYLEKALVRFRTKGNPTWKEQMLELPDVGAVARIELPPAASGSEQSEAVEVYAIAYDSSGNEVLLWGSEKRPREIGLRYEAPDPWYGEWWVWVTVGAVVAAGAGAAVFAATREPPDTATGHFGVSP